MRACEPSRRFSGGFTLLELMVTVTVLAILVAVAVPSFTSIINANRLAAQSNEVVAALQLARTEAIRHNRRAVVCRSANGTTCAGSSGAWQQFITLVDTNGNRTFEAAERVRVNVVKSPLHVSSGSHSFVFRSDGMARTPDASATLVTESITVCIPTSRPKENRRTISLATGSRISVAPVDGAGTCP